MAQRTHALDLIDSEGNTQTINCNRHACHTVLAIRKQLGIVIVSAIHKGEQLIKEDSK